MSQLGNPTETLSIKNVATEAQMWLLISRHSDWTSDLADRCKSALDLLGKATNLFLKSLETEALEDLEIKVRNILNDNLALWEAVKENVSPEQLKEITDHYFTKGGSDPGWL